MAQRDYRMNEVEQTKPLSYETWPCPQHPGPQAYLKDECPGDGYNHTHCGACHNLYFGYVHNCPMHAAAPELLEACIGLTTRPATADKVLAAQKAIARATGAQS